ncbi:adenine deaminase [Clostridium autoethanogenum]|uniref:Adenine deaminase n=1 Tax=Clostridium autoethanogenum DSM 10061 TaxID=1341692 RepID=A0ABN4BCH6_9CLOT|nr:adenine deaminase [Clostridium autoethanogenum]AGY75214.1 adenine deaminase [Clostridium autoethanogenum DSM 10061]ALU35384.1 Adenine deaminase [Clostridium autoethanogenum DSM 10061]OVY49537.1 Adenine deaminase [Clostridium autoethanogenum]
MKSYLEIKKLIECGLGEVSCDLKLSNVNLVNVYSEEIYGTNIYIKDGRVVCIDPDVKLEAEKSIDCSGKYAIPGFIDSHLHIETTLLSPEALSDVIVPKGTTTLCADLMEIANVCGIDGIKALLDSIEKLPYRTYIEIPSRVPTAPGLETTGGVVELEEVIEALSWDETLSLGELDPSKILFKKEEYLKKIEASLSRRKIINGHAIGITGRDLNVYAASGMSDDHECVSFEELLERIRLGMDVFIREGSSERNVEKLIKGVVDKKLSFEHLMFCTDDKHASDIKNEGHINYNVNKAISLGVSPINAIQMATINAAKHFRVEDEIGSITPGRKADIIIVKSLENIQPSMVFFEGKLVAEQENLISNKVSSEYPDWIKNTVKFKTPITPESFKINSKCNDTTCINAIELIKDQIINKWIKVKLPVKGGLIQNDVEEDILKLAVVERYGKTGGVGIGFVKGFNIKDGALSSSVSHDHHNIVCVGTDDYNMSIAVNEIKDIQGGFVLVKQGKVIGKMLLPIGGLMSDHDADSVIEEITSLNNLTHEIGCTLAAPFMTLSFISLPTVPELGLTDIGLIDVLKHEIISTEIRDNEKNRSKL